jgi:hypothetical protein
MFRPIVLVAFLVASAAHAETATMVPVNNLAEFFAAYDNAPDPAARSALELMIVGAEQALQSANAQVAAIQGKHIFCQPEHSSLTTQQIIQLLRIAMRDDQRYAGVPVGFALLQAYVVAYPCPK